MIDSWSSGPMTYPGGGATPAGNAGAAAGLVVEFGAACAPAFCGSATAETALVQQAKQKAKIRVFSKIFRAPTMFDAGFEQTSTAGQLCKYVARGRYDSCVAPNYSMTTT